MKLQQHYLDLPECLYQVINPEPLDNPQLVIANKALMDNLLLPDEFKINDPNFLIGNQTISGSSSLALGYAGHQFGNLVPQLGDGRAHLLGQVKSLNGQSFDLQLKGSGRTRYSRSGDGRCTLKAAMREYLISEYLDCLNIPTTRSLYVASSTQPIMRQDIEQTAVVCRVAKSHIRIGSFQFAAMHQDKSVLANLADFTIKQLYPALLNEQNPYLSLFNSVKNKLIDLVVSWMANGFIHGVMNTDNMLLSGESIDFGPCAFMGQYKPLQVFSSIDQNGRYAYVNQPAIMHWNLARFAETLIPLVDEDEQHAIKMLSDSLNKFVDEYQTAYHLLMCKKLALDPKNEKSKDLILGFFNTLEKEKLDFRAAFSDLTYRPSNTEKSVLQTTWYSVWQNSISEERVAQMTDFNPQYYFDNYTIEAILDDIVNDPSQAEAILGRYFAALKGENNALTPAEHSMFDLSYQTFCGT